MTPKLRHALDGRAGRLGLAILALAVLSCASPPSVSSGPQGEGPPGLEPPRVPRAATEVPAETRDAGTLHPDDPALHAS